MNSSEMYDYTYKVLKKVAQGKNIDSHNIIFVINSINIVFIL
jgi:hypothetical protein